MKIFKIYKIFTLRQFSLLIPKSIPDFNYFYQKINPHKTPDKDKENKRPHEKNEQINKQI